MTAPTSRRAAIVANSPNPEVYAGPQSSSSSSSSSSAEKLEQAAEVITSKECLSTLCKVIDNILNEKEYSLKRRSFKKSNATFVKRIKRHDGGLSFLYSIGFDDCGADDIRLQKEDANVLWEARRALDKVASKRKWKAPPLPTKPIALLTKPKPANENLSATFEGRRMYVMKLKDEENDEVHKLVSTSAPASSSSPSTPSPEPRKRINSADSSETPKSVMSSVNGDDDILNDIALALADEVDHSTQVTSQSPALVSTSYSKIDVPAAADATQSASQAEGPKRMEEQASETTDKSTFVNDSASNVADDVDLGLRTAGDVITSKSCLVTLCKILDNIITETDYSSKRRRFKLNNATFQKRVGKHKGGVDFLVACGFQRSVNDEYVELHQDVESTTMLMTARNILHDRAKIRGVETPPVPSPPVPSDAVDRKVDQPTNLTASSKSSTQPQSGQTHQETNVSGEEPIPIVDRLPLTKGKASGAPNGSRDGIQSCAEMSSAVDSSICTSVASMEQNQPVAESEVPSQHVDNTVDDIALLQKAAKKIFSKPCLVTLCKILDNILDEEKFTKKTRKFKLDNATFHKRVARHSGGLDFMIAAGFTKRGTVGLELLRSNENREKLLEARAALVTHATENGIKLQRSSTKKGGGTVKDIDQAGSVSSDASSTAVSSIGSSMCTDSDLLSEIEGALAEDDDCSLALSSIASNASDRQAVPIPVPRDSFEDDMLLALQAPATTDVSTTTSQSQHGFRRLRQDGLDELDALAPPTSHDSSETLDDSRGTNHSCETKRVVNCSSAMPTVVSMGHLSMESDTLDTFTDTVQPFDGNASASSILSDDDSLSMAPKIKVHGMEFDGNASADELEAEMALALADHSTPLIELNTTSMNWALPNGTEGPKKDKDSDLNAKPPNGLRMNEAKTPTTIATEVKEESEYHSIHAHSDWMRLSELMLQHGLHNEYETCLGAICTLSLVCSDLSIRDLNLPGSKKRQKSQQNSKRAWLPFELVQGVWRLVLNDKHTLSAAQIDHVCKKMHDVLVSTEFLEVHERPPEEQELPHPTWIRVRKEKIVLLGFALPIAILKQNEWMQQLAQVIVEDIEFWYGRYALPSIALAGDHSGIEMAKRLLRDQDFVQTRLDVLGLVTGTQQHLLDSRNYTEAAQENARESKDLLRVESIGDVGIGVALDACQQLAICMYRTGQILAKSPDSAASMKDLCIALHLLGKAAGEWGDSEFEMQVYEKAMQLHNEFGTQRTEAAGDVLLSIGACHLSLGDFDAAAQRYEQARETFRTSLGEKSDKEAKSLHLTGIIHCECNELDTAMECFKRSLRIRLDNGMTKGYDAEMADTLCWIAKVFREQDMPDKAKKHFEQARDAKEELFGSDSLEVAEILHNLAVLYDDGGDFKPALTYYSRSLRIRTSRLGDNHEDVCELIACIANIHKSMGDHETALKAFRHVLELRSSSQSKLASMSKRQTYVLIHAYEDVLEILSIQLSTTSEPKKTRSEIATLLVKMGHLYDTIGKYERSLKCFSKALKLREHDGERNKAAHVLNVMGISYAKRRAYHEAMKSFEDALALRRELLGESHIDVAETLHNMGNCTAKSGDLSHAIKLYNEALRIKRKMYDDKNATVAQTLHNLGNVMIRKGSSEVALEYYLEALSIRKRALGNDHLDVAFSYNSIAKIYRMKNEVNLALESFASALRIKRHHLGKKHRSTADTLEQLGSIHWELGELDAAACCWHGALAVYRGSKNGSTSSIPLKVGEMYEALANLSMKEKKKRKALHLFLKALRAKINFLGEEDLSLAELHLKVGLLQKEREMPHEALASFQAATRIRKKSMGRNDAMIADILSEAGQLQLLLNQVEVAMKCFTEALRIRRQLLGIGDAKIGDSLVQMADVYQASHAYDSAVEVLFEALEIFQGQTSDPNTDSNKNIQQVSTTKRNVYKRLGKAYASNRNFRQAEECYLKCQELHKTAEGEKDIQAIGDLNHEMGIMYFESGNHPRAEELFRDAVEFKVQFYQSEDHAEVVATVLYLGRVCLELNSPDEATMYLEQAQMMMTTNHDESSLESLALKQYIGKAHELKGEYEAALECYQTYLRARRAAVGDDKVTSDLLHSVGRVEGRLHRYDASLKSLASALALYRVLLGDEHLDVAQTLFTLGLIYDQKGDYRDSLKYHKEAYRLRRKRQEEDEKHSHTSNGNELRLLKLSIAASLQAISGLYLKQPNLDKALQSMKESLRIRTATLGKDHLDVATCLYGMGVILTELNELDQAMECYRVTLEIRRGAAKRSCQPSSEALWLLSSCNLHAPPCIQTAVGQTFHNRGTILAKKRLFEEALAEWRQAVASYQEAGFTDEHHLVAVTMGNIHMAEAYVEEEGLQLMKP